MFKNLNKNNLGGFSAGVIITAAVFSWAATEYVMTFDQIRSWVLHEDLSEEKFARALSEPTDAVLVAKKKNINLETEYLNYKVEAKSAIESLRKINRNISEELKEANLALSNSIKNKEHNRTTGSIAHISNKVVKNETYIEFDQIGIALKKCKITSSIIDCDFLISNNRLNDSKLAITHGALFDQNGQRFNAIRIDIAKRPTGFQKEQILISGISTIANISFDVSKGNLKNIVALKFNIHGAFDGGISKWGAQGSGIRRVSFKNPSFTRG